MMTYTYKLNVSRGSWAVLAGIWVIAACIIPPAAIHAINKGDYFSLFSPAVSIFFTAFLFLMTVKLLRQRIAIGPEGISAINTKKGVILTVSWNEIRSIEYRHETIFGWRQKKPSKIVVIRTDGNCMPITELDPSSGKSNLIPAEIAESTPDFESAITEFWGKAISAQSVS